MQQDKIKRHRNIRLRSTAFAGFDYLVNILLLTLFWYFDVITFSVLAKVTLMSVTFNALFFWLIIYRAERMSDPSMTGIQVFAGCGINLAALVLAPQIAYMFVINLFVPLAYGSLHFSQRNFINAWILMTISLTLTIVVLKDEIKIDLSTLTHQLLFCLVSSLALARFLFINADVSNLRRRLGEKNRELKRASESLTNLVTQDELTGIANRRMFLSMFNKDYRDSRNSGKMYVALVDIDHFKKVNDTYGHLVGDTIICAIAKILCSSLRQSDCVARYGGEEFAVLLSEQVLENAISALERARQEIENTNWEPYGVEGSITISAGLAKWSDKSAPEAVLKVADDALYQAKRQGRNRVIFNKAKK